MKRTNNVTYSNNFFGHLKQLALKPSLTIVMFKDIELAIRVEIVTIKIQNSRTSLNCNNYKVK